MIKNLISRTRRNHALEHATIHVLSERRKGFSAQGNSTPQGFFLNIYGDVSEEEVASAVTEAHQRMKNGERHLAVHPNCGTVLLTTATLATLAGQMAFALEQRRQQRPSTDLGVVLGGLPSAVLAAIVALIVARPIGMTLQERYTTDGNLGKLEVRSIRRIPASPTTRLFQLLLGKGQGIKATAYEVDTIG